MLIFNNVEIAVFKGNGVILELRFFFFASDV